MKRASVRVIGSGLIGTSIALKLRELGHLVDMRDLDEASESLARDLVESDLESEEPAVVFLAVPPNALLSVLQEEQSRSPSAIFIDVSSVKTNLQRELETFPEKYQRFVSTHPIAGREISGAQSARSDLFDGRAWIISSGIGEALASATELITSLGATPYQLDAVSHDRLFAQVSHLPQLVSTALALAIESVGPNSSLAGQGLRDMLRLAASDGELWSEILTENIDEIKRALTAFQRSLDELQLAIESNDKQRIIEIFDLARTIRASVDGKHGAKARDYDYVSVVIDDRPGQLGAIFNDCGSISINIEDLALEHSPKQETGLIRLAVTRGDGQRLQEHLRLCGWKAHRQ